MRAVEHRGLSSGDARARMLHAGPNAIFRPGSLSESIKLAMYGHCKVKPDIGTTE